MIAKTTYLMLTLSVMSGFVLKRYNPEIARRKNGYNFLNPKIDSPEIFKVSRDTVHVNIEGKLSRALLIHDKYYAFYEVRDPMSTQSMKKFYIIEKNGKIEKEIKVPEGIHRDTYYKLYYWRGRIIVNTTFYAATYYLDQDKGEFVENPETTQVPLFEDENYEVISECNGEFGSKIYFRSKLAKSTYLADSGCPFLINKVGDKYFVNTYDDIMEIKDPIKVEAAPKKISANTVYALVSTVYALNTTTIFRTSGFVSDFYIPTSFVAKGILYHIYNSHHSEFGLDDMLEAKELDDILEAKERVAITKDSVKIGTINDGQFKPVYKFKDKFDIQLQQQLSSVYQICTFHTEERMQIGFKKDVPPYREAKYGVIEIMGNQVKIHYFISKKSG